MRHDAGVIDPIVHALMGMAVAPQNGPPQNILHVRYKCSCEPIVVVLRCNAVHVRGVVGHNNSGAIERRIQHEFEPLALANMTLQRVVGGQ